jgi:outer membrane protein TolC
MVHTTKEFVKVAEKAVEDAKEHLRIAELRYNAGLGLYSDTHKMPFGSEGDSWQLMAFLRWELFDGTKREYERSKAKYKVTETEEYLNGLKKAVAFKVYEAYLGVQEAKKNVELSKTALKTADEGKRLVKIRYENALSPIVDLMDAQVSLDRARASLVAKENEYRLAVVNLSYESGTILRDLKIEH